MKITEAIRRGWQQLLAADPPMRQIRNDYARPGDGADIAGMAFLGNGTPFATLAHYSFDESTEYPDLCDPIPQALCPPEYQALHPSLHDRALLSVLIDLNDEPLAWSVPRTLDWLESLGR